MTWVRVVNDKPEEWETSVCDPNLCWAPFADAPGYGWFQPAGADDDFYVQFDGRNFPDGPAVDGHGEVEVIIYSEDDSANYNARGVFIADLSGEVGFHSPDMDNQYEVYPNPAVNDLNILTSYSNGVEQIQIVNLVGKVMLVQQWNKGTGKLVLDISNLPEGIYFYYGSLVKTRCWKTRRSASPDNNTITKQRRFCIEAPFVSGLISNSSCLPLSVWLQRCVAMQVVFNMRYLVNRFQPQQHHALLIAGGETHDGRLTGLVDTVHRIGDQHLHHGFSFGSTFRFPRMLIVRSSADSAMKVKMIISATAIRSPVRLSAASSASAQRHQPPSELLSSYWRWFYQPKMHRYRVHPSPVFPSVPSVLPWQASSYRSGLS